MSVATGLMAAGALAFCFGYVTTYTVASLYILFALWKGEKDTPW